MKGAGAGPPREGANANMTQPNPIQDAPETPARARPAPTPQPRAIVCPYCGAISGNTTRCDSCSGRFDPLSRQATQNAMGPWFVRDEANPTLPGCAYDTLVSRIDLGKVNAGSVVRGPTTRQFWMLAKRVPGVSHLLGFCHACQASVSPDQYACTSCGAVFQVDRDRQHLGLGPARLLPGQGSPERIAAFSQASDAAVERPSWAWAPGEAPAPGPAQSCGAAPASAELKLKRLERALARQRAASHTLIGACVILLAAVFVVSVMSRSGSRSAPTPEQPGLGAVEADRRPEVGDAGASPGAAVSPIDELGSLGAEPEWPAVRDRVMTLIAQGSSESLSAGVLELEALMRRGELPAEGVELLERLRTEMDDGRLRNIP